MKSGDECKFEILDLIKRRVGVSKYVQHIESFCGLNLKCNFSAVHDLKCRVLLIQKSVSLTVTYLILFEKGE